MKVQIASLLLCLGLNACSSSSSREHIEAVQDSARPHSAAYAADGFMMDHRSPADRPYRGWEFYYKECALVSRNPYPSHAEYSCSDPK